MLQRLPIPPAQGKTGTTSENWLNENRQIICSLYRANEITKKVYNNIMNSLDHTLCHISQIILNIFKKNMEKRQLII